MNFIFVFVGEFGYELLNWQGVVRKFATTIDRDKNKIIICSREGLEPFYEFADKYITIAHLSYFKNSVANMYWAHNPDCNIYRNYEYTINNCLPWELMSQKDKKYQKKMNKQITNFVLRKLNVKFWDKYIVRNYKFIFSSHHQVINDLEFGTSSMNKPKIYNDLNLSNNLFCKIKPPKSNINIKTKLGFEITNEYILCQTGARSIVRRSGENVSLDILNSLSKKIKIILLDFDTKRHLDSKSNFENMPNCYRYSCSSFAEQSVLIANAKCCLFFTEGDFRSHNYIPPFMGKNVYSIAPKSVFELNTSPIEFWNRNVFRFGGQIIPIISEDIVIENFIHKILNIDK